MNALRNWIQSVKNSNRLQLIILAFIGVILSFLIPNIWYLNTPKVTSPDQYIQYKGTLDTIKTFRSSDSNRSTRDNTMNIKLQEFPKPFSIPPNVYSGAKVILIQTKIRPGDSIELDIVLNHGQPENENTYEIDLITGKEKGHICGIRANGISYFSPEGYNKGQKKHKRKMIVGGVFISLLVLLQFNRYLNSKAKT